MNAKPLQFDLHFVSQFFRKVNVRRSKSKCNFISFIALGYYPLHFPLCVR